MAQRHKALAAFPTLLRSLRNPSPQKPFKPSSLPSLRRAFSLYDQINLIDQVNEEQLRFESFTDTGFTVNGVQYEGSILCVGNMVLSWKPKRWSEVIPDSLSVFQVLRPSPGVPDAVLLLLGCCLWVVLQLVSHRRSERLWLGLRKGLSYAEVYTD